MDTRQSVVMSENKRRIERIKATLRAGTGRAAILHANHDLSMALGEHQSYTRSVLVRNSYTNMGATRALSFVRFCCTHAIPDLGIRKHPDGEIFLPLYLSSQPFLSTNSPQH